ncbi:hypothetical protein [Sorangium sp. So ce693]|uniref:hypothetical protein n=1 Tax=Sorangium sp. So ce693 TaxID=3133318 RepID=UPI003F6253BB
MSGPRWARRARRATQAVVAATGLALLALRYVIPALMMQAHPIGSTASPYGYVEYVPPEPGPRPLLLVLHGGGSRGEALTLTEFARGGHAVFVDVYAEDATWRWLFAQRRGARAQ